MSKKVNQIALIIIVILTPVMVGGYTTSGGVEDGDLVTIDYLLKCEGEEVDKQNDYKTYVTEQDLIIGFYEGILEMKVGDVKAWEVPPEKGYSQGELSGKILEFEVYLKKVYVGDEIIEDEGPGVGKTLLNAMIVMSVIVLLIYIIHVGNRMKKVVMVAKCYTCESNGKVKDSVSKCKKCGTAYCRKCITGPCKNCGGNTYLPNDRRSRR